MASSITRRAVIDNIAFDVEGRGQISVRVSKLTYLDGELMSRDYHTIGGIEPDEDLEARLKANSAHLTEMGFGPIEGDGIVVLKAAASRVRTKDRVNAAKAVRETARREALAQEQAAQEAAEAEAQARAEADRNAEAARQQEMKAALAQLLAEREKTDAA